MNFFIPPGEARGSKFQNIIKFTKITLLKKTFLDTFTVNTRKKYSPEVNQKIQIHNFLTLNQNNNH